MLLISNKPPLLFLHLHWSDSCGSTLKLKNIIFDFGDVFINLDKIGAFKNALEIFNITELDEEMIQVNMNYEKGLITTSQFLQYYKNTHTLSLDLKIVIKRIKLIIVKTKL